MFADINRRTCAAAEDAKASMLLEAARGVPYSPLTIAKFDEAVDPLTEARQRMLEDFQSGAAFRETDEGITYISLIDDLLTGQYGNVQRIVAFNPVEGWSRDASEDIAGALSFTSPQKVGKCLRASEISLKAS